ncbi:anthranilate phosphoribosyltransferase [Phycisphaerales bacterium]|nr:anthranilate phosphoribosyltransferase [Phycisphaerales bacterium]
MTIRETLAALVSGRSLTAAEADALFEDLFTGRLEDSQIGAALALMAVRGPSVEELLGGAGAMRRHVTPIPGVSEMSGRVIDTCGTGGARKTFNVSTLAAVVTAAAGGGKLRVAKHGNRGRSGRGSAEVLRALGVNIDAAPDVQARCLREVGVCFCFAIHHHPAMKHAAKARQALGFPTIFNALGPLTNPAGATRQVMGVYSADLVEPIATVLARLGCERAMVVHADDGIDEISTTGATTIAHVEGGGVRTERFDSGFLGLARARVQDLDAADLDHAVRIARSVLGGESGPAREMVLLNSAAALIVGDVAPGWPEGLAKAVKAVDSGAAARVLEGLVRESNETGRG